MRHGYHPFHSTRTVVLRTAVPLCFALAAGCSACKSDEPPPLPKVEKEAAEPEPEVEETNPYLRTRQAYGAPLPPEVVYLKEGPAFVEVGTKLRLKELRKFFETRLVDVEYIERDRTTMRIVGLRSGMPTIWIKQRVTTLPTQVTYVAPVVKDVKPEPTPNPQSAATAKKTRQKGDPIEDRLPDGRLIAPGARWGEPYTPPQGSPLHDPRFRANYGKPFGTWILN